MWLFLRIMFVFDTTKLKNLVDGGGDNGFEVLHRREFFKAGRKREVKWPLNLRKGPFFLTI